MQTLLFCPLFVLFSHFFLAALPQKKYCLYCTCSTKDVSLYAPKKLSDVILCQSIFFQEAQKNFFWFFLFFVFVPRDKTKFKKIVSKLTSSFLMVFFKIFKKISFFSTNKIYLLRYMTPRAFPSRITYLSTLLMTSQPIKLGCGDLRGAEKNPKDFLCTPQVPVTQFIGFKVIFQERYF